jgi:REP element-mobilizing transposase RayT
MARGYMATSADQLIAFTTASAPHSLPLTNVGENTIKVCLPTPRVKLRSRQRALIEEAIRETCKKRKWEFWATNVRTNHVHAVVGAACDPERILIAFKANATRKLRAAGCWRSSKTPWVERGSKRYLWTESDVINAVVYVEYDQGGPL